MRITTAYFSATNTTKTIISSFVQALSADFTNCNLTRKGPNADVQLASDDLLVVGMPVYGGRIPSVAVDRLKMFKGSHTPVILIAVYGNREFEDAFVEMQDIVEGNAFFVIAAGAFIAQHSIFPHTAKGRPDASDLSKIKEFAARCRSMLEESWSSDTKSIQLPGNRPYKIPSKIPLKVVTSNKCVACRACVNVCPVGAIPSDNPHLTDYEKCIRCGRCIYVCAEHARHYGGLLFHVAGAVFSWKNRKRKEPQFFF